MRMIKFSSALALATAVLMLAGSLASAQVDKGKRAPDFKLPTLDGKKEFSLKPLITKGKEQKSAVVIAFWASWCGPCWMEAPELKKLHEEYEKKDVAIIGIAVQDTAKRAQAFVDENKLKYTMLLDANGSKAGKLYGAPPIPYLYVLDGNGIVRAVHRGYHRGIGNDLKKELDEILAAKAKAEKS